MFLSSVHHVHLSRDRSSSGQVHHFPSPYPPHLQSAVGKKQFCWEERDKLFVSKEPNPGRGVRRDGQPQEWQDMVFAWLPPSYPQASTLPAACLSRFPSNDISQAAAFVALLFHQGKLSSSSGAGSAWVEKTWRRGKAGKPWGLTSEGSQLSGLGCLVGRECYLTGSKQSLPRDKIHPLAPPRKDLLNWPHCFRGKA